MEKSSLTWGGSIGHDLAEELVNTVAKGVGVSGERVRGWKKKPGGPQARPVAWLDNSCRGWERRVFPSGQLNNS